MPDQKVMRCHFNHPGQINPGDILQCPACRWKFVLLPEMLAAPLPVIPCPNCRKTTDQSYYYTLSLTGGIELTNWGKNDETKEVKPDGQPRSRKGVSKQRSGVKDGDQAHPKKTRSPRSKST